jgi:hypothetical protein
MEENNHKLENITLKPQGIDITSENNVYYSILTDLFINNQELLSKGFSKEFLNLLIENHSIYDSNLLVKSNIICENNKYYFKGYYESSILLTFSFNNLLCLKNSEFVLHFHVMEGFAVFCGLNRKKQKKI